MTAKFIVAVAFVIERDGAILMLGRSPTKDNAPGEWEFGSGRVEYGEHPEDAVHREVREETGLEIDIVEPLATKSMSSGMSAIGVKADLLCST